MPYINNDRRLDMIDCPIGFQGVSAKTAGELNYCFTMIINEYLYKNESYQTYNDIIGALEGCKMELYRRKIAPYEDKKILENGDVY